MHQAAHQIRFVGALGEGGAHVQCMRAALGLVAADLRQRVEILRHQEFLDLAAALGVEPLADEERWRRLAHRYRAHRGRQFGRGFDLALKRRLAADTFHQPRQVLGRRAAAPADDVGAELLGELGQVAGERLRLERVHRPPVDVQRHPGVGDDGDVF